MDNVIPRSYNIKALKIMNSLQLDRFPLQSKLQPVSIQPSLANIESYLKRIKIQVKRIRGRSQNRLQVYLFGKKTLLD